MSDEKTTIYISPEDDLTGVRERLEKIPARYITLVIPIQSQLRSHVAWKLLRARSRELGKEILIVSTDPQIRSVAQAVKFKVAHSLESSPTGKSRPLSRPGRSTQGNRGRAGGPTQRPPSGRGTSELHGTPSARPRQSGPMNQWSPANTDRSFVEQEPDRHDFADDSGTGPIHDIDPSSFADDHFDTPGKPPYDFRINTSPPIHPLSQQQLDEEPDLWIEDFNQAQNIRQAASQKGVDDVEDMDHDDYVPRDSINATQNMAPSTENIPHEDSLQTHRMAPLPNLGDDPFASMDDALPPPPGEQHGAIHSLESFDTHEHTIQDVADLPTDAMHGAVEYQGDQGDFVVHSDSPPAHSWSEPIAEDDQDRAGPPRVYGVRPRTSRTGRQPASPVPPNQQFGDDHILPPISDRPTQVTPQVPPLSTPAASGTSGTSSIPRISRALSPSQVTRASGNLPPNQLSRASGSLSSGSRASGNLSPGRATRASGNLPPAQMPRVSRDLPPKQQTPTRNRPALSKPVGARSVKPAGSVTRQGPPSRAAVRPAARRRRSGGYSYVIAAIVVVIIAIGLSAYLLPSADITVMLPARDYSAPVKIVANPTNKLDEAAGIIQDEVLQKDFTIAGTGKATGSAKIGTALANGLVFFTNNGNQQIIIPSGILVSTKSGTDFVTQAEVSVGPKGSNLNRLPTQIQAQISGDSGNVPAGSVTSIPPASLNTIAQRNNIQLASLSLQVTNDTATTGGGVGNATSVTQKDLDTTQSTLGAQLQNDINAWIKQQLSPNDVAGKPVLTPTLINAPKVNDIESNATFSATLKQNVELPIVHSAALQSATIAQLDTALSKDKNFQNFQVVADPQQPVQIPQFTPVSDGLTLTLNFTPKGKIIQKITADKVQGLVSGKTAKDADATLKGVIVGIQTTDVKISPSLDPIIPWRTDHIHVKFVAGSSPPTKK